MSLVEQAKLTDEELEAFDLRDAVDDMYGVRGEELRGIADAQLAKALWAVVGWLQISRHKMVRWEGGNLGAMVEMAGIEKPKGVA
uniref:Uncharacterized protein n=1 Tax=viral metagenome TaxID=1070528 RepID=A0A6M3LH11_9ZZZZ